jgi:hypothetical protein
MMTWVVVVVELARSMAYLIVNKAESKESMGLIADLGGPGTFEVSGRAAYHIQ